MCRSTLTAVTTPIPPHALQATITDRVTATAAVGFLSTMALDMGTQDAITMAGDPITVGLITGIIQGATTAIIDAIGAIANLQG